MLERAMAHPQIELRTNVIVEEVLGVDEKEVKGVKLKNAATGEEEILHLNGVFLGIGHEPNAKMFHGQIDLDSDGYVLTQNNVFTTRNGQVVPGCMLAAMFRIVGIARQLRLPAPGAWLLLRWRSIWKNTGIDMSLNENLEKLEEAIQAACRDVGRHRSEIELMAVSKTYPAETMLEAEKLGLRLFGENRVQEFAAKAPALAPCRESGLLAGSDEPIQVHLIGHLQSNKALRAQSFLTRSIHSIRSPRRAAQRRSRQAPQAASCSDRSQAQHRRDQRRPRS